MAQAPFVLVDLITDEGVTGRSYAFCYIDAAAPMIQRVLALARETIIGATVDPEALGAELRARFRLLGAHGVVAMGLSALDVACWDALAIAAGMPLAHYLGAQTGSVPAYNSNGLSLGAPESLGAEAQALLAPGFNAVKIRLGRADAAADLAAIRAVRAAVPEETVLMADFNQALAVGNAITRCRELDSEQLAWIEEPIAADDLTGCAQLAVAVETPIQLGENLYGPAAVATAIAQHASDYQMFDLMRIGGVSGWLEAARIAAAANIPVSSHLYPEVSVHLLAATQTAHWLEFVDWVEPLLTTPSRVCDGKLQMPTGPGTGIRWDEAAVRRYAMD